MKRDCLVPYSKESPKSNAFVASLNHSIILGKVCTISFERPEASPWTFTVPVQLSAFHYLTAS